MEFGYSEKFTQVIHTQILLNFTCASHANHTFTKFSNALGAIDASHTRKNSDYVINMKGNCTSRKQATRAENGLRRG